MAHELEQDEAGKASFAFNGDNGLPWHRLGEQFDGLQTAEVMLQAARANYHVSKLPVYIKDPATGEMVVVHDRYATARIDLNGDLTPFEVFKGRYEVVQNADVLDKALAVVGASSGDAVMETVGVLKGGRQFFASIDLGSLFIDPLGVNDQIRRFIVVKTSHDGSSPIVFANTDIRVVCANTLRFGIDKARSVFKARHTPNLNTRLEEAQEVLRISTEWADSFRLQAEWMLTIDVTPGGFDTVIDAIWPAANADTDRKRDNRDNLVGEIKAVFGNERNSQAVGSNGWAAYNAVGEYLDWYRLGERGTAEAYAEASLNEAGILVDRKVMAQRAVMSLA